MVLVAAVLLALDVVIFAFESFSSSLYGLYGGLPNNWCNANKNTIAADKAILRLRNSKRGIMIRRLARSTECPLPRFGPWTRCSEEMCERVQTD